jgi:hypothetical protein
MGGVKKSVYLKMRIRILPFLFLVTIFISCQKDKVNKAHPEMIGDWRHVTADGYFAINIQSNGRGYIYEKTANNDGQDTQRRTWLIKKNKLIFSRFKREQFTIDLYPTLANTLLINDYDSVRAGQTYMILDGRYFIKQ